MCSRLPKAPRPEVLPPGFGVFSVFLTTLKSSTCSLRASRVPWPEQGGPWPHRTQGCSYVGSQPFASIHHLQMG